MEICFELIFNVWLAVWTCDIYQVHLLINETTWITTVVDMLLGQPKREDFPICLLNSDFQVLASICNGKIRRGVLPDAWCILLWCLEISDLRPKLDEGRKELNNLSMNRAS